LSPIVGAAASASVGLSAMLEPRTYTEHKERRAPQIPHAMPAMAIEHFGDPDVLTEVVLPVPKTDATEVLIALDTAGVGPWDAKIRAGWYPGKKPRFPLLLGTDGTGIVAEVVREFLVLRSETKSMPIAGPIQKVGSTPNMSR
jgi:hypothetical protein